MPKRILLVDDDKNIRENFAELLESYGHNVVKEEDGKKALEVYDKNPVFYAVVTDNRMPNMTGIELGSALRETRGYKGKIVLMTGTPGDLKDSERKYFDAVLEKPFRIDELVHLLGSR